MSYYAKILLCGIPLSKVKSDIDMIVKWDNGHNYPVLVYLNPKNYDPDYGFGAKYIEPNFEDTPQNLKEAIFRK